MRGCRLDCGEVAGLRPSSQALLVAVLASGAIFGLVRWEARNEALALAVSLASIEVSHPTREVPYLCGRRRSVIATNPPGIRGWSDPGWVLHPQPAHIASIMRYLDQGAHVSPYVPNQCGQIRSEEGLVSCRHPAF